VSRTVVVCCASCGTCEFFGCEFWPKIFGSTPETTVVFFLLISEQFSGSIEEQRVIDERI
jgi:hypothetical protein